MFRSEHILTCALTAAIVLCAASPAFGFGGRKRQAPMVVTSRTISAGSPLLQTTEGKTVPVSTRGGYSFLRVEQVLKPGGKTLGTIKYRLALPKGKAIADVPTVLLTIPPGGSAPLVAQRACAEAGFASVAIQSVTGDNESDRLASIGIAVVQDLLTQNPSLKFVFCGFSMGGFGAQAAAFHLLDRCVGLLLIGNYYLSPPLPNNRAVVMLVGSEDMHLPYAKKSLREQIDDYGANVQLMIMPGGHGYGRETDQDRALKALLAKVK